MMAMTFFERLSQYFQDTERTLAGEASASSVLLNSTDRGNSREQVYINFLKRHVPRQCTVSQGGFLFGWSGEESRQIDAFVTVDHAARFAINGEQGKAFACVDGCVAIVSIKSALDKKELLDSLGVFESLPAKRALEGRVPPFVQIKGYDDWPLKIIFATAGIAPKTILGHLDRYYSGPGAPPLRERPNLIHVAGGYSIVRAGEFVERLRDGTVLQPGRFHLNPIHAYGWALAWAIGRIQGMALAARQVSLESDELVNRLTWGPAKPAGPTKADNQ